MQRLFSGLCISLCSLTAWAQHDWKGTYIGGYLGGAIGSYQATTLTSLGYYESTLNTQAVNQSASGYMHPQSFVIGVKAGEDWMLQNWVVGAVLDYGYLQLNENRQSAQMEYPVGSGTFTSTISANTDWLFTLRGRAGHTFQFQWPSLWYATAGMAMTKVTVSNTLLDNTLLEGQGQSTISANQVGWTLGAGIESQVVENFRITVEYLYVHIPSLTASASVSNGAEGFGIPLNGYTSPMNTQVNLSSNIIRFGLNYRFSA